MFSKEYLKKSQNNGNHEKHGNCGNHENQGSKENQGNPESGNTQNYGHYKDKVNCSLRHKNHIIICLI